ncbi:NAD(P)H-binding protein [Bacillus sp. JCM 19041]|uniref:NAD(P)H-binding protein n=1 Tax=Bacillus sp. JCM 19041 TaxID=1460637 RepID=UPI0006D21713
MIIVVAGATGTVGRHVVNQLVAKEVNVRALSRNPEKANLPESVKLVKGDLNKPETLAGLLDHADGLFLLSSSDEQNADLNTDPEVIKLAEEAGVKHVAVLVGYEEGAVEQKLKTSKMQWTLLKPGEFMANALLDWQDSIRNDGIVREPFGDARSSRIHEGDIAAVAVAALMEDGHHERSYLLTGKEALSRREAVQTISEVLGKPIAFKEMTEQEARLNWEAQGYGHEDIEFFVLMGKNPPKEGSMILPTVEQVIGRPARSFSDWVVEHKTAFQ